jgi:hypothetical protein
MASKFFERRSIRNQLKTYLDTHGWVDMNWSEGFSTYTIETVVPPFIAVMLIDMGRTELELGHDPTVNKVFDRRVQIDVFMEDENRVEAITDDISDFLDLEVIIIKDNNNSVLGNLISSTESIIAETDLPDLTGEANLRWSGTVAATYEAHYPNG